MKKKTGKAKKTVPNLPAKSLSAKQAGSVKGGGQPVAQSPVQFKYDLKAQRPA